MLLRRLKNWPSLNNRRLTSGAPYLVYNGTLADCIRELLAKPVAMRGNFQGVKQIVLKSNAERLRQSPLLRRSDIPAAAVPLAAANITANVIILYRMSSSRNPRLISARNCFAHFSAVVKFLSICD